MRASNLRRQVLALAVTVVAGPAAVAGFDPAEDPVAQLLSEASTLHQQASAVGFEWLETAKLIRQARELLAAGDTDEARRLAELARLQADQSLQQANREAAAWQRRVVK